MTKQEELTSFILAQMVTEVGYSDLTDVLPDHLKHLKSGITILVRLQDQIISEINPKEGPTHTYFHHYRTVNTMIDQITLKIATLLQQWGYLALPIPASQSINQDGWNYRGLFPHRTGAVRSGLGWIGKNCCLVTEKYGPRVRLGTVLTNLELDYGKPVETSQCGSCQACVKACPAQALKGALWVPGMPREEIFSPELCSAHMKKAYQHIGRGAVCGICLQACPKGNQVLIR